ncbi:MAG: S1C family serine protease [Tropicimonas sp.]|uniref:S1C family serine protease n=1 Tax=Tropicimonas sp. TaxID=2067044 RepID=UPI003A87AA20
MTRALAVSVCGFRTPCLSVSVEAGAGRTAMDKTDSMKRPDIVMTTLLKCRAAGLVFLFCLLASPQAPAFTRDEVFLEFDARTISQAEKRFLQAGLAFLGTYNAMLDGAWGKGSQHALERYAAQAGVAAPVPNWLVSVIALSTLEVFDQDGWEQRHIDLLDISLLVPSKRLRARRDSNMFINLNHTETSLGYSLTRGDASQVTRLHGYTLQQAMAGASPYQVRRGDTWITSARTAQGLTLYTRSDRRRAFWSTVMLSAGDADGGQLAAVSGSINPGGALPLVLPHGRLMDGIVTVTALLDAPSDNDRQQAGAAASLRERTAPEAPKVPLENAPQPHDGGETRGGTGTGFVVSPRGHVLTNHHVAGNCGSLEVDQLPATLVASDRDFDLALLAVEGAANWKSAVFADKPARLNSDVTVVGYPLTGLLGGLNVTRGTVSSLKGLGGHTSQMQISAPVQPGNSGGPVVDASGNVVGVVVAKLDAQMVADLVGDIPQNINFAIRGEIAKLFLFQNGVEPVEAVDHQEMRPEELAEHVQGYTRLITCTP